MAHLEFIQLGGQFNMASHARIRTGNFGKCKPVGEGVSESKVNFGPGFRIYYGIDGDLIVLLCGGDKSFQDDDIKRAKRLWRDYKNRKGDANAE